MHDLIIASTFLAMLFFPCLAALRGDIPSDEVNEQHQILAGKPSPAITIAHPAIASNGKSLNW